MAAVAIIASNPQSSSNIVKQAQDVSIEIMEVKIEPFGNSKDVKKKDMEETIFGNMDDKAHAEKFKKYEADFKQYLMGKYFSDKTILGGNIFDTRTNIDGETTTASKLPPYQSFADPASFAKLISKASGSSTEAPKTSTSDKGKKPAT